jgi:tight adherence protein B
MQTTADTMRERAYLRRHVRSLSAEGRFSAWILVALPIGTAVMLYIARPEYVTPLFTDPIGIVMLAAAAVLMVIGGLWLKAAIKVEV